MTASEYQERAKQLLTRHYEPSQVVLEWAIHKNATDSMRRVSTQYYPRTDIAVGPFSTSPGGNAEINLNAVHSTLREKLQELPSHNPNPRCLLAIEVVFSGSSKHLLGDILNASVVGLYGIVVGSPTMITKIKRNREYLIKLAELKKMEYLPFQNVLVLDTDEFERLLA